MSEPVMGFEKQFLLHAEKDMLNEMLFGFRFILLQQSTSIGNTMRKGCSDSIKAIHSMHAPFEQCRKPAYVNTLRLVQHKKLMRAVQECYSNIRKMLIGERIVKDYDLENGKKSYQTWLSSKRSHFLK